MGGRYLLVDALGGLINLDEEVHVCDFKATRSSEERRSRTVGDLHEDFSRFNYFIDGNFLINLPLCGRSFTWYRGDDLSMNRLDQFLLYGTWCSLWPNCIQVTLPRGVCDHCSILLTNDEGNWAPRPQRMLEYWVDLPGCKEFV